MKVMKVGRGGVENVKSSLFLLFFESARWRGDVA